MKSAVLKNLEALSDARTHLDGKRLYELSELSYLVAEKIKEGRVSLKTPYAFADAVRYLLSDDRKQPLAPQAYQAVMQRSKGAAYTLDLSAFSLFLSERISKIAFSPFALQGVERKTAKIAYVPSLLAEEAYLRICEHVKDASVLYAKGAEEACAALAAGESDFALLPILNTNGERLSTIEKLTLRYKTYIAAAVRASHGEGGEALFGLFSLSPEAVLKTGERCLSLDVATSSYSEACDVLSCLSVFGFLLSGVSHAPTRSGGVSSRILLRGCGDERALWFFLSLCTRDFTLLGSYFEL